ncbi:pentapeptide repeat-containing protein [Lentibacillus cibarius]|uniref:Pentapeptide repeat-containing protein n=1 Tax=Lentibacillus cibarius TaxID=2583219 RepID=A0A5S3QK19_9BACI|nr:pentapeptide repeat-containing protein [Lentibacillus cibarius]TMN22168.1 pentapeptide repeat-containing protein [Lentibacillus cibarius]
MVKKKRAIQKPDLPDKLDTMTLEKLTDQDNLEMGVIQEATGDPIHAEHVRFEQMHFQNVRLNDAILPFSHWLDVIFENCDLSGVQLQGARLNRVSFRNCKLAGADLDRAVMSDVTWTDCQAPYLLCNQAELRDVYFDQCLLKGANFMDVSQDHLQLDTSDIQDVQFTGTSLNNVDLSRCAFGYIHLGEQDLRGAVIAPEQASALIGLFGVNVKDE